MAPFDEESLLLFSKPNIHYYDLASVDLEIFKTDENLEGKITLNNFWKISEHYQVPVSKFRLQGDTLLFEMEVSNFLQKQSFTNYLIRNGDGEALIGLSKDAFGVNLDWAQRFTRYVGSDDNALYFTTSHKSQYDSLRIDFLEKQIDYLGNEGESKNSYDIKFLEKKVDKIRS